MKSFRLATGLFALTFVSCSSGPVSPTQSAARPELARADSTVTSSAVTTTRLRLRVVEGGDIMTGLQTGQSINVPLNVKLDVWAEVQRLETDRARLVVDWGNGNSDFSGCGACRVENTYKVPGRYTLTAKVMDLNAAGGSDAVTTATVTLNVVDAAALSCAPVSMDFEAFTVGATLPVSGGGVTVASTGSSIFDFTTTFAPFIQNHLARAGGPSTITFDSDKNEFSVGVAIVSGSFGYSAQDASGGVVATGTFTPTLFKAGAFVGELNFSGPVFRRVVLTPTANWAIDNIRGSCS
jgi:hypothetical protein